MIQQVIVGRLEVCADRFGYKRLAAVLITVRTVSAKQVADKESGENGNEGEHCHFVRPNRLSSKAPEAVRWNLEAGLTVQLLAFDSG